MTSGLRTDSEGEDKKGQKSLRSEKQSQAQTSGGAPTKTPGKPTSDGEEAKDAVDNMSDIETPRMDVTGLKLDAAQKEKTSFLQELKKQSFVLSEDST